MISNRALKIDSSGIRKVFELAEKIKNPINLSIGQPDFDVPEECKEAAIKAIKKGLNKYTLTQGIGELREKLLDYIYKIKGKKYNSNEIIITSGVSGGLFLALISILDPGDEVIIFDPYFVMYKHLVNLLDAKPVIIDTYPDFKISYEKINNVVNSKTKAIIINSPSNPTGYVYTNEDIDNVIKVAKENNILIISDEIYDSFVYNNNLVSPVLKYDNVLLLGGFSKSYAMTGWRLGYAVGNSDLISQMIKIQQYSFVCAPAPFQYAAVAALDIDISKYREEYKIKRDLIYEGLKENFDIVKPEGAFYIFPKLKFGDATSFVELAIQNNILIIPGNVFSEKNTNFRISYATDNNSIKKGIELLNSLANEYYKKFQ